MAKLHSD